MDYINIKGANVSLGAPAGWNEDRDGPCGALPVRVTRTPQNTVNHCESAWMPDALDLQALNAGHAVILRVYGGQPAVAVYVDRFPPAAAVERTEEDL